MQWYWIVLITIFVTHVASALFIMWGQAKQKDDTWVLAMTCWSFYFLLLALFYPIRAMKMYSRHKGYYKKYGVSRLAYLLGKRVK